MTPWTAACQASLFSIISRSLLKFMCIELMMLSNHLILCHSLLLTSFFPQIRVFSSESALCIRRPKYWSFSFSICPSNKYLLMNASEKSFQKVINDFTLKASFSFWVCEHTSSDLVSWVFTVCLAWDWMLTSPNESSQELNRQICGPISQM